MRVMKGLSASSLKGHPALVPLFVCVTTGMVGAFGYLYRLASRNPDVCINRKNNPYPWEKLEPTHQYKFYSPVRDYSKLSEPEEKPKL